MMEEELRKMMRIYGVRYSEKFHIDLRKEPFKLFILAVLFGAPIRRENAIRTYKIFEIYDVLTPDRIIEEGWDNLVAYLDSGGYTRYDFRTATKLLEIAKNLEGRNLVEMHEEARDFEDLVKKLKSLARGVGDTAVGIFMREMVGVWDKARPYPNRIAKLAAENIGIWDIEKFWKDRLRNEDYAKFESLLAEIGRFCRREKCAQCPAKGICKKFNM